MGFGGSVLKRLHQNCSKIAPKNIMSSFLLFFYKHSFHIFQFAFYKFHFLLYHIILNLCSLFTNKICFLLILVVWKSLFICCFMFTVLPLSQFLFRILLQIHFPYFSLSHFPFLIISYHYKIYKNPTYSFLH